MAAYNWRFSHITRVDKQAIVAESGFAYNFKWKNVNLLTAYGRGGLLANNQETVWYETLGVLAFDNDSYPDRELQSKFYDVFHTVWIERILAELNYFYRQATG
jgi:hypothetical protein